MYLLGLFHDMQEKQRREEEGLGWVRRSYMSWLELVGILVMHALVEGHLHKVEIIRVIFSVF
jgi:hypothetical protein